MNNPTYKFFRDELEDHEIQRYSNGREIEPYWSTDELKSGAARVIAELEARGYKRMSYASNTSISYAKPNDCKSVYVGTFVNPFTYSDKIFWWSNYFAKTYKCITIHEVYRGNGTSQNATLEVSISFYDAPKEVSYKIENEQNAGKINKYGVITPNTTEHCFIRSPIIGCRIRKFKPNNTSDKVLKNIINKAEEELSKYEIKEITKFEKDSNNYPNDNRVEYWNWRHSIE